LDHFYSFDFNILRDLVSTLPYIVSQFHRLTGNESHNGRSLLFLWVDCDDDERLIDERLIDERLIDERLIDERLSDERLID